MNDSSAATAVFRLYAELNDFLPQLQKGSQIALSFVPPVPVRHLIELLGVPHTEVELIIANGRSVGLDYFVCDGDLVSVYPVFEAFDISPLLRLRHAPLRESRFVVDVHLGKLNRYRRMLGFDSLLDATWDDRQLAAVSAEQHRILLTRDKALLMRACVTHGCYVRSAAPKQQLRYLLRRLDLYRQVRPFTRCIECNGRIDPVAKKEIEARLPEHTRRLHREFWRCAGCGRVYWKGSHYSRMNRLVEHLANAER